MIKLVGAAIRLVLFSFLVILLSQIPVNDRRICDHVGDLIHAGPVEKLTRWVARTFDFKDPNGFSSRIRFRPERSSQSDFSSELKTLRQSGINKLGIDGSKDNELTIEKIVSDKINKSDREELESLLNSQK